MTRVFDRLVRRFGAHRRAAAALGTAVAAGAAALVTGFARRA
jgi:hypothetical protein